MRPVILLKRAFEVSGLFSGQSLNVSAERLYLGVFAWCALLISDNGAAAATGGEAGRNAYHKCKKGDEERAGPGAVHFLRAAEEDERVFLPVLSTP